MSNSGYDPFDYGLIKPDEGAEAVPVPQGDPEDMLFDTDGIEAMPATGSPAAFGAESAAPTSFEGSPNDAEDLLFDPASPASEGGAGVVFESASPPAFEETAPVKRKERPSRLSVGRSTPSAPAPTAPSSPSQPQSPPWLQEDPRRSRTHVPAAKKADPESRLALKVASPGASHHRRPSTSGSKILPLLVFLGGMAGGSYCYVVLDKMILAGLVCAMGLIGSMFCAILLRSKPL